MCFLLVAILGKPDILLVLLILYLASHDGAASIPRASVLWIIGTQ